MIYTKVQTESGYICCPVTAKNTYTKCAGCGKEIPLNLREVLLHSADNAFAPEAYCAKCTEKMMHSGQVDIDTLTRLVAALGDIGYREQLCRLFNDFDISSLKELVPEEYPFFTETLIVRVAEALYAGK